MPNVTPSPCPGTGSELCGAAITQEQATKRWALAGGSCVSERHHRRRRQAGAQQVIQRPAGHAGRFCGPADCPAGAGVRPRQGSGSCVLTEPPLWPLTSFTAVACFTMAVLRSWERAVEEGKGCRSRGSRRLRADGSASGRSAGAHSRSLAWIGSLIWRKTIYRGV